MHLAHYIALIHGSQTALARAMRTVADAHAGEVAVFHIAEKLARQCDAHAERLAPFIDRYGEEAAPAPQGMRVDRFGGPRPGPLGLLRDLHDLYVLAAEVDMAWTLVGQAAQGARDRDLLAVVQECEAETATQMDWLRSQLKQAAPQTLVVAS